MSDNAILQFNPNQRIPEGVVVDRVMGDPCGPFDIRTYDGLNGLILHVYEKGVERGKELGIGITGGSELQAGKQRGMQ